MFRSLDVSIFGNVQGLTYHASNEEDPYIVMNEVSKSDIMIISALTSWLE
jgi:hypothetical protein